MHKNIVQLAVTTAFAVSSCSPVDRMAYYVSPFNAAHNAYHTIPPKADSMPSAFYTSIAVYSGKANELETDEVFFVQANFSGAHNFKNFQAYYAASLFLGNYKIASIPTNSYGTLNASNINRYAGNNSFSGQGIDGGVNWVLPVKGGEWRVIGVEASLQKDNGKYAKFRKELPAGSASYIARSRTFSTVGAYTELVSKFKESAVGVRLSFGSVLGSEYNNLNIYDIDQKKLIYNYFNGTVHLTKKRFTGYVQAGVSCKAGGALFGVNYRVFK